MLKCLSDDIIPASIGPKSNTKTPKGYYIIKKAERVLLNERIRSINNIINMFNHQRVTCKNPLKEVLDRDTMEECDRCINIKRESRHLKTFECWRI